MLYHQHGRDDLAIPLIKKSVDIRPDVFAGVINLGMIQRDEGLLEESQASLERAVLIEPDSAIAHVTLGLLLMDRGELDRALELFEHGFRLEPGNPMTHARMGMLQQVRGETDAAVSCFSKVIELAPDDLNAHRSLAFLQKQTEHNDNTRWMETAFASTDLPDRERMLLGYALGKVFDDLAQFDKAFEYLHAAHQIRRKASNYSTEQQKVSFERHKQGQDRTFLSHCKNHVVDDETPVFVLGMPRSGTSLVEQILASHPLAYGAGEVEHLRYFAIAAEKVTGKPFPLDISTVPPEILREAGLDYVKKLRLNAGDAQRVIDKLPHNFLRVGLIAAVMPRAKIVLCERDPLDNCMSIYQHLFGPAHAYASDLSALGQYYTLFQDLMEWWDEILPGHVYHVKYEQLVADTGNQVRQLLKYCGLPFHENCLSFHKTQRRVGTPSEAQVRQPIYQGSIGRWKNYRKHLGPLIEALGNGV
jgi:tetratricopeptide (TPR) repeat protein